MNWILVFIGGGLGSIARYGVSKMLSSNFTYINPQGTFVANILASLLLGILMFAFTRDFFNSTQFRLFLATGFCGGFSTFSTFSYETFQLLRMQEYVWAVANVLVSVFLAIFIMLLILKATNI